MARVLVVDDNRDLADTTAALLRARGYEVMTLYDGVDVLLEADRRLPDAIVLDIGLPHVDGIHVARLLRERYGESMRLIACTGYGDEGTRQKMLQAGFDAIFIKPVTAAGLLDAIATAPLRRPLPAIAVGSRASSIRGVAPKHDCRHGGCAASATSAKLVCELAQSNREHGCPGD